MGGENHFKRIILILASVLILMGSLLTAAPIMAMSPVEPAASPEIQEAAGGDLGTGDATDITSTSATLNGELLANSGTTDPNVYFEYGPDTNYG